MISRDCFPNEELYLYTKRKYISLRAQKRIEKICKIFNIHYDNIFFNHQKEVLKTQPQPQQD